MWHEKKNHFSFGMIYIQHVPKYDTENKRKPESPLRHDWFLYHSWNSNQLLGQYIKSTLKGFVIIHISRVVTVLSVNLDFPPILLSLLSAQQHRCVLVLQKSIASGSNKQIKHFLFLWTCVGAFCFETIKNLSTGSCCCWRMLCFSFFPAHAK